jgi:hypothetical protein
MNMPDLILGCLAAALGLWYAALGISAIKHLRDADEMDKVVGWSLWWCLDLKRYDDEGQRICKHGLAIAVASILLWILVYVA